MRRLAHFNLGALQQMSPNKGTSRRHHCRGSEHRSIYHHPAPLFWVAAAGSTGQCARLDETATAGRRER